MGKGSARRKEDIEKVWSNWDAIFGKKDKEQPAEESKQQDTNSDAPKENAK